MRVRHLAKMQRKRDAKALPPCVSVVVTATGSGVTLRLGVGLPCDPPPPDDVDVLIGAGARLMSYFAKSTEVQASDVSLIVDEKPWSDGFALVMECGWVSPGVARHSVVRYSSEGEARAAAARLWCCWVLFREDGP